MKPRKNEIEPKPKEPSSEELMLGTVKAALDELKTAVAAISERPAPPAPVLNVPDNTKAITEAIGSLNKSIDNAKKSDKSQEVIRLLTRFINAVEGRPVNVELHESEKRINLTVTEADRPVLKAVRPFRDNYGNITKYEFDWSDK